jgi:beta-lactamase class A
LSKYARFLLLCVASAAALLLLAGWPGNPALGAPVSAPAAMLFGSAPDSPDAELQALIESTVAEVGGDWGVAVKKLDTGQFATYSGDEQHVSASLYKMWVLNELFRQAKIGNIDLDGYTNISGADAAYDASLGDLRLPAGSAITLRRAAYLMVTISDNTASHMLVRVLGPNNINRFMQRNGLSNSLLDWSGYGDNLTTPVDVLRVMEKIATSEMVDAEASRQMVEIMLDQQVNNILAPGLPEESKFAHKHGNLDALLHDAGIVYGPSGPFVIVAMSSRLPTYSVAYSTMPRLMSRVYEYFNKRPTSPAQYFPQTRQTVGHDFLKFWHEFGGVDAFGYPIGPEHMRDGVLVQWFERGRFEWHSAARGAGPHPNVTLGLVGSERAQQLSLSWPRTPEVTGGRYFTQTGQLLQDDFYEYWLNNGGERRFGYPVSPAQDMVNPSDGKTYLTQWFERARMELNPELPEGNQIVLGALGTELAGGR